jgi:hypothetical protein
MGFKLPIAEKLKNDEEGYEIETKRCWFLIRKDVKVEWE